MNAPTHHELIAARFPLWGSRLIEASAGTGKTWTIAALYLRLVLGHGDAEHRFNRPLGPSEILVMTFTKAATRELSDRIRARLLEAARCFRGEQAIAPHDTFLQEVLAHYPAGSARNQAAWRLAVAAEGMDDASVYTIDAWCQRMLREHAFDSGSLFEEDLVADEYALLTEAAQDYWRRACYPLDAPALAQVLATWKDVPTLVSDVAQLLQQSANTSQANAPEGPTSHTALGAADTPTTLLQLMADWVQPIAPLLNERVPQVAAMRSWLASELADRRTHWNKTKLKDETVAAWLDTLSDWSQAPLTLSLPDIEKGLTRLTPSGLRDAQTKAGPADLDIPPCFGWFEELVQYMQTHPLSHRLRQHAATQVAERLSHLKRLSGTFGFADMLTRLNQALSGSHGARLRERIVAQYPVALIDEFQDTSPLQYSIFDQIYQTATNAPQQALMLIGDPKQSIYGFRGADIYSYLQARAATEGRHYVLQTNYRSTQALVDAVNHCFAQAEVQRPQAAFMFQTLGGTNPLPFVSVQAHGRPERFVTHAGMAPAMTVVHDPDFLNAKSVMRLFADRCAEQIVTWLNDAHTGFSRSSGTFVRLNPQDVAVLVRTGKEAQAIRRALQRRGVASVYLSDKESVFQSDEAHDLVHWLRAVATPQDATLVRAALAVRTLGLSLDELGWLASDDEAFDVRSLQFRALQHIWQSQGVLAMLRQTLHRFGLATHWLTQSDGERRLTNFLHLGELLQNASSQLDGEQALIRWLLQQITETGIQSDEQVMRLESDANLVKVITIHKSKGLEYPVVCLPFASGFRPVSRKTTRSISLPDETGARQLLLELSDEDLERADTERLREDLRLLYVALTRPRHALWLGFAALKIGNSHTCQSHQSGAGYLFGGPTSLAPEAWESTLTQALSGCPQATLQVVRGPASCTRLHRPTTHTALQSPSLYQADFDRDWSVASYTRLTRELQTARSNVALLTPPQAADDEWNPLDEVRTHPPARVTPTPVATETSDLGFCHTFTRGPQAGNFLHDQLEWLASEGFQLDQRPELVQRLQSRCERAGFETQAPDLTAWLNTILNTPLPGPEVALSQLTSMLPEMEFWLPAHRLSAATVDTICQQHLLPGTPRPALQNSTLHGMLMGFADLVFEYQGRYWVLDYKSNHLGSSNDAYSALTLHTAMAQHRYDVQAALYLLALHRLLQVRLGTRYQPDQHLGGAVYLFIRGIHHPGRGACVMAAPINALQALDAMLHPAEACT